MSHNLVVCTLHNHLLTGSSHSNRENLDFTIYSRLREVMLHVQSPSAISIIILCLLLFCSIFLFFLRRRRQTPASQNALKSALSRVVKYVYSRVWWVCLFSECCVLYACYVQSAPAFTYGKRQTKKYKWVDFAWFVFGRGISQKMLHLNSLELVEDGLGELVGGGGAAHVGGADLAVGLLALQLSFNEWRRTYPSAITA